MTPTDVLPAKSDGARPVRVRFAPSPTGSLHLGGARTAIYNWAFARACSGSFILRIDDTDPERSTPENIAQIISALQWLGIDWDEGPVAGGDYGPYFQTERAATYVQALETLRANGWAYRCFCTPAELALMREAARAKGGSSGYDGSCRALSEEQSQARADAGEPFVWRLKIPADHGPIAFDDAVCGHTEFPEDSVDDFVLVRSDGSPTYNFASIVDDATMAITHVIRGNDHVSNTPKQILVLEGLGAQIPTFAHLSMINGPDGKKLSKRHGSTGVEEYADKGYLPEALMNYLALLGWSLDGETTLIDADTLKTRFSLEHVAKRPANFDFAKLTWMNGEYLRAMETDQFAQLMVERLAREGLCPPDDFARRPDWYQALAPMVSERAKLLTDIAPITRFLFVDVVKPDETARAKVLDKDPELVQRALRATLEALEAVEIWDVAHIEAAMADLPDVVDAKPRLAYQPLRVAIAGSTVSLPLNESMELLGREKTLARIRTLLQTMPEA
ncbi:MAG: glutamate--tRNA ligase [Coriobacteriia bacterium]|nr:glutamate--tRNA ligase [Coriobacteriia bacterium]